MHWNVDLEDWKYHQSDPGHMEEEVGRAIPHTARAGGIGPIILQHDNYKATARHQGRIIDLLRRKGYRLVSLSKCLGLPAYQ